MTGIVFYDFDFNRIAEFPKAVSVNIEKKFCGYGTAELHFSVAQHQVISILTENKYLFFKVDNDYAIVTGWRIGKDIAVFGRTPEWLLTKRGIKNPKYSQVTAENIARDAVSKTAGDFIALGEEQGIGAKMDYSADSVIVLYDLVTKVLSDKKFGFSVVPDFTQNKFLFSVYSGRETRTVISMANRNAYDMEYTLERQDMATKSGWYMREFSDKGNWNAIENEPGLVDSNPDNSYTFYKITSELVDASGDEVIRFGNYCFKDWYLYSDTPDGKWKVTEVKPTNIWIFINQGTATGARRWDKVINGRKTFDEALLELNSLKEKETSIAEIKGLEYGRDYKVGDLLKVQFEFGEFRKTETKRVSAVNIYYDINKSGISPVFSMEED